MNWINPLHTAYNVPNTLFLSFTAILILWVIWRIVKKERIPINRKTVFSTIFWVLLTAELRVLKDLKVIKISFFVSPWLYYIAILFSVLSVYLSYKISRKKYWYSGFLPLTVFLFFIPYLPFRNYSFIVDFSIVYLPWFFLSFGMYKDFKIPKENFLVLLSQTFDASVTTVSIKYFGYVSKHVIPTLLIDIGGPFSFLLSKFVITFVLLLFIDKKIKNKKLRNYIKLLIAYFAILTGTRDLIRVLCLI